MMQNSKMFAFIALLEVTEVAHALLGHDWLGFALALTLLAIELALVISHR